MKSEVKTAQFPLDTTRATFLLGLTAGILYATLSTPSHAAGFSVQEIHSPGPAISMSDNGNVVGYYETKCATLTTQPKRTICYYAPWLFDGQRLTKLGNKFPSSTTSLASGVNNAGDVIGANSTGAWYYAGGQLAYVDGIDPNIRGSRLMAVNNNGVAIGMSYVSSVYQPITYQFQGVPSPTLAPGYLANDINDLGMSTGSIKNSAGLTQGFVADARGAVTIIPALDPAINCWGQRISQTGTNGQTWVAGNCSGNRAFRYELSSNTLTELTYPGGSNLSAVSINSHGETAGTALKPGAFAPDGYTAVLWTADSAAPLDLNANNAFAPATAWNVHATDISENGTVLTGYNDISGNFFTFLLRPLP